LALWCRHARRGLLEIGNGLPEPRQHGLPILDGGANLPENFLERGKDGVPLRCDKIIDVDGDVAFLAAVVPASVSAADHSHEPAVGGSLALDERMQNE